MIDQPLSSAQIRSFHEDGFVVCDQLLSADAHAGIVGMVDDVAAWPTTDDRWHHYHEQTEHGPALTRTENFLPYHEGLRNLLTAGTLVDAVGQLFGEPARVFKEKINYKLPGGAGFAPHQDARAYAYGSHHITCLVAIDANHVDNGCLWFAPAQHRRGLLDTDDTGCLPREVAASLTWRPATMAPGGVAFFSSFAPHKSDANDSPQARRSLYVTYSPGSEGDLRRAYYSDRAKTMSEHEPGDGAPPRISTIGHFQGRDVSS